MRIIGTIDHPDIKISIFKMDNRISVKFENSLHEQTYKLGDDERFASLEAVKQWVDENMLAKVMEIFGTMHRARLEAMQRMFFSAHSDVSFPDII